MIRFILFLSVLAFFSAYSEEKSLIKVKSPKFKYGDFIPQKYTCDGQDVSPPLNWNNYPENTKSFVLIVDDPDAPIGIFTHWVVYDIPANINHLEENFPKKAVVNGIKQGINDFGNIWYGGPCPPPGKPHRYFFKIYALDIPTLNLPAGATKEQVEQKMLNHIIAQGKLIGLYKR